MEVKDDGYLNKGRGHDGGKKCMSSRYIEGVEESKRGVEFDAGDKRRRPHQD